ncbi:hypothetical protein [Cupriavidus sp. 8B]
MAAQLSNTLSLLSTRTTKRPLHDLFLALPLLPVTEFREIDYAAADPQALLRIAACAEAAMQTIHLGLSAIALLFAHAAPQIEANDISGDPVAAVSWLMADLGEFIAFAQELAMACRAHTADYVPSGTSPTPSCARPWTTASSWPVSRWHLSVDRTTVHRRRFAEVRYGRSTAGLDVDIDGRCALEAAVDVIS